MRLVEHLAATETLTLERAGASGQTALAGSVGRSPRAERARTPASEPPGAPWVMSDCDPGSVQASRTPLCRSSSAFARRDAGAPRLLPAALMGRARRGRIGTLGGGAGPCTPDRPRGGRDDEGIRSPAHTLSVTWRHSPIGLAGRVTASAGLLCRDCGNRRCACCRPDPCTRSRQAQRLVRRWSGSHPRDSRGEERRVSARPALRPAPAAVREARSQTRGAVSLPRADTHKHQPRLTWLHEPRSPARPTRRSRVGAYLPGTRGLMANVRS